MSRISGHATPVIEWSSSRVRSYVPGQGVTEGMAQGFASVRAALARRNTFVRAVPIPNVGAADMEKILRLQLPKVFPVPAEELVFAYRATPEVTAEGRIVVVSAARADIVRTLHIQFKEAGVRVSDVIAAAWGSQLLAKSLDLPDVAVVDRTAEDWSIDIISGGELRYSRAVPLETDAAALESEVCRTFGMAGMPCGKILAASGLNLEFADIRSGTNTLEMLAGAEAAALHVGLELPEVLAKRAHAQIANRGRLAVLMAAAAVAVGAFVFMDRAEDMEAVQKNELDWKRDANALKKTRDAAQAKVTALKPTQQLLDRAFRPAQRASEVLGVITSLTPKEIWLTGVTFDRGKPIQLRGTALDSAAVARFLESLSAQDRFRDVKLVFANDALIDETKVNHFSISMHAVGNLPLVDARGTRRTATR